jgi:hypothetical protein
VKFLTNNFAKFHGVEGREKKVRREVRKRRVRRIKEEDDGIRSMEEES